MVSLLEANLLEGSLLDDSLLEASLLVPKRSGYDVAQSRVGVSPTAREQCFCWALFFVLAPRAQAVDANFIQTPVSTGIGRIRVAPPSRPWGWGDTSSYIDHKFVAELVPLLAVLIDGTNAKIQKDRPWKKVQ